MYQVKMDHDSSDDGMHMAAEQTMVHSMNVLVVAGEGLLDSMAAEDCCGGDTAAGDAVF